MPVMSDSLKKSHESKLSEAMEIYRSDSSNADAIIWVGRRRAYLGRYQEAISVFSRGIALHPNDPRMYRHRGYRYISLRCFDKAIADFEKAVTLIKDKPDEIEPDGIPNAKNIPTSSLHSNIWYHLGLAYFLKADYQNAYRAYQQCLKVSANPDMYVATANWLYITLRKLNKKKEATKLLETVDESMDIIENGEYLQILYLYKGVPTDHFVNVALPAKYNNATTGFGWGNFYLLAGRADEAMAFFKEVTQGNQWSSFGFIAAEMELQRMRK
jgi:tetratricopeptide (TPR) repeat protein